MAVLICQEVICVDIYLLKYSADCINQVRYIGHLEFTAETNPKCQTTDKSLNLRFQLCLNFIHFHDSVEFG